MKHTAIVLLTALAMSVSAQTVIRTETITVPASINYEDVKAIGMGKAQFANGMQFNAMLYNPALLTHERSTLDIPAMQASVPTSSVRAFSFLADNVAQFRKDGFIAQINRGLTDFRNAGNDDERLAALRTIQRGLRFVNELQEKVGGPAGNPTLHGLGAAPRVGAQIGNWGVAVYGSAQTSFALFSSDVVSALSQVPIPATAAELDETTLLQLLTVTGALLDANGDIRDDAIPRVVAVSHADLVAAGGYAHDVSPDLSIGGAVKVVRRSFSARAVSPDNFSTLIQEMRRDLNSSTIGVTMDLGALYRFPHRTTSLGVSVQNVVPIRSVTSDMTMTNYAVDENGAIVPFRLAIPFELTLPLLVNAGVSQVITDQWDASFDLADIASRDDKYEDFLARVRFGSEYRLSTGPGGLGVAFRGGVAEKNLTVGLGLNIANVVQLDGAYAHDNFVGENAWFAQAKFGW